MKVDDDFSIQKEDSSSKSKWSLVYALCAGLSFSVSNCMASYLSQRMDFLHCVAGQCLGAISSWALFHIFNSLFQLESSQSIYRLENGNFNFCKFVMPAVRACMALCSQSLIFLTFQLLPSNVNSGIVSSIFTTSIIYACFIFYFLFGQKLTRNSILGISLIVICVACISLSNPDS